MLNIAQMHQKYSKIHIFSGFQTIFSCKTVLEEYFKTLFSQSFKITLSKVVVNVEKGIFQINKIEYNILQQQLMGQKASKYEIKEGWSQKFQKIQIISQKQSNLQDSKCQFKVKMSLQNIQGEYQAWKNHYNQMISFEEVHQYIILPKRIQKDVCIVCADNSTGNNINLYYKPFYSSLQHQIKCKKQVQRYYSEQELWYLMLKLVKIAAYFEWKKLDLGNIHPKNVIIFNQDNRIKLFSTYSSPNELTNLSRIKFSNHEDCYIAPQQIQIINPKSPHHNQSFLTRNKNKIDLFNIGLTLLSAALLKDCYFIYDRTQFLINQQRFNAFKHLLKTQNRRYSETLIKIILQFLQVQPCLRKTPIFYYSFLSQYEQRICRFELINASIQAQIFPSPLVVNYHDKTSPYIKQSKYITLSKDLNTSKNTNQSQKLKGNSNSSSYNPGKINRKLFS